MYPLVLYRTALLKVCIVVFAVCLIVWRTLAGGPGHLKYPQGSIPCVLPACFLCSLALMHLTQRHSACGGRHFVRSLFGHDASCWLAPPDGVVEQAVSFILRENRVAWALHCRSVSSNCVLVAPRVVRSSGFGSAPYLLSLLRFTIGDGISEEPMDDAHQRAMPVITPPCALSLAALKSLRSLHLGVWWR